VKLYPNYITQLFNSRHYAYESMRIKAAKPKKPIAAFAAIGLATVGVIRPEWYKAAADFATNIISSIF